MLYDLLTFNKAAIAECMVFDAGTPNELVSAMELCRREELPHSLWDYTSGPVVDYAGPPMSTEQDRALLFTTIINYAVSRAEQIGADTIMAGFCEADLPITKPDLTAFCIAAGGRADILLEFEFPFLVNEKWRVFDLARQLNRLAEVLSETSSCESNEASIQHSWGYGCGACRGCVARWNAWDEYLQKIGQGP